MNVINLNPQIVFGIFSFSIKISQFKIVDYKILSNVRKYKKLNRRKFRRKIKITHEYMTA